MSSNFAGIVFSLMWGMPYLTHAEGRSTATASTLMTVYVIANAIAGPTAGILTSRHPIRRGTLIEAMINQELGEPFRRDAMKKPVAVAGIHAADMA